LHHEIISFQIEPIVDFCVAGNNISHQYIIIKYEENFKEIKRMEQIDDNVFACYGISVSKKDRIYITDCVRHVIHRLDLDLVRNRTFGGYGMLEDSEFINQKGCKML
jgi:hypothetical protein